MTKVQDVYLTRRRFARYYNVEMIQLSLIPRRHKKLDNSDTVCVNFSKCLVTDALNTVRLFYLVSVLQMQSIQSGNRASLREIFSQHLFHQYRMIIYNKFMISLWGYVLQKKEVYLPLHEVSTEVQDPHKIMVVKTHLNTSSVKLPVTSRVNPQYLKRIHMVEKYAHRRGVIHSLTNTANMVG